MSSTKQFRRPAISLFSGAGGLDLGLEAAGFDVRLCVESDASCRKTLAYNRPGWTLAVPGDVHLVSVEDFAGQARLRKPRELALLAGGPPCQPFSKSGYWANGDSARLKDPRASTLDALMTFASVLLPEVILIENVKGIAFNGKNEAISLLTRKFSRINKRHRTKYKPQVFTINCAEYGVPQLRERVFVVAHRDGDNFNKPKPTFCRIDSYEDIEQGLLPYRTAWDAIGDLDTNTWDPALKAVGKWADLLPSIPEGSNYLWHTPENDKGQPLFPWRSRYWSFLLKLAKNMPSWTIQAQPGPATGPFHWRSRRLSIRELSRIQSFPDNYTILGNYQEGVRQVGNAVPPAIGYLFGKEIRRQLLGERVRVRNPYVVGARGNCPSRERRRPVPKKYFSLRANHKPHPGTGRGPGALRRTRRAADGR